MDLFYKLFDTSDFITPEHYKGWTPLLLQISEWSNLLLFVVYTTIPILLLIFSHVRGPDKPIFARQRFLAICFSLFIFSCGLTHLLRAITFHYPVYRLLCAMQIFTVLVSWFTAFVMIPLFFAAKTFKEDIETKQMVERIERIQSRLTQREQKLARILMELDDLPKIIDKDKDQNG